MKKKIVSMKRVLTEKCPNGHNMCMSAKCWTKEDDEKKKKLVDDLKKFQENLII